MERTFKIFVWGNYKTHWTKSVTMLKCYVTTSQGTSELCNNHLVRRERSQHSDATRHCCVDQGLGPPWDQRSFLQGQDCFSYVIWAEHVALKRNMYFVTMYHRQPTTTIIITFCMAPFRIPRDQSAFVPLGSSCTSSLVSGGSRSWKERQAKSRRKTQLSWNVADRNITAWRV